MKDTAIIPIGPAASASSKAKRHTLEKIIDATGKGFNEEKVHSAMLLSYVQSLYEIMRKDCVPSPLYRFVYDEDNNNISVSETEGKSLVPIDDALDIDALDVILISNLRDIPILFEGDTGVGKTYVSQRYFKTIFPKESFVSLRLSGNTFLNNIFQPFLEGSMVNGMPVTKIKRDAIETIAALFVDEINRGDPQSVLQLLDNELYNAGEYVKLGIKIPVIDAKAGKVDYPGKRKKLEIITAQNPASTSDAKFTSTVELDAAVDNRLLKTYFGNSAPSAGATLWLGEDTQKPHKMFLEGMKKRASKYLGVKEEVYDNLESDWLQVYSWITESSRTDKPILYSAIELSDFMTAVFSGNLIDYYNYEKGIVNSWAKKLSKDVKITYEQKETDTVKQINEVNKSFKVPIIFRDTIQIKKLADVLSTLKNIKEALKTDAPLNNYLKTRKYVSVREVAGATALLALNKQAPGAPSPTKEVNAVLNEYVSLTQKYMKEEGYMGATFKLDDPNAGIKRIAVHKALRDTLTNHGGADYFINQMCDQANKLINHISASESLRNMLVVRSASDLMTLAGFIEQYKTSIEPLFNKHGKELRKASTASEKVGIINQLRTDIGNVYYSLREEHAMVMPDIYMHRIQRTLGV